MILHPGESILISPELLECEVTDIKYDHHRKEVNFEKRINEKDTDTIDE